MSEPLAACMLKAALLWFPLTKRRGIRERAAPLSIRYSIFVSGSVKVSVVVEGHADTVWGSMPTRFLVQLQGVEQLKVQAAVGVFLGSLLMRFLETHRGFRT